MDTIISGENELFIDEQTCDQKRLMPALLIDISVYHNDYFLKEMVGFCTRIGLETISARMTDIALLVSFTVKT